MGMANNTTDQLIEAAKAEMGHNWTPALETAIREGLVDGDVIHLGGHLLANVHGDRVVMTKNGVETANIALSELTEQQRDRMLILKGQFAGRVKS